jgi:hypothetical protein
MSSATLLAVGCRADLDRPSVMAEGIKLDVPAPPAPEPAVKPFECCRRHRFRPGTKASNPPNLEATTGQAPKDARFPADWASAELHPA